MVHIRRRDFFGRLGLGAGAAMLLPFTRSLVREARADGPLPNRLVIFTQGNGFRREHHVPVADGEPSSFVLGGANMHPVFEPLAPYADDLLLLEQFYNPHDRALHGNQWATLSMRPSPNQEGEMRGPPGGISIDRYVATERDLGDPFSSIALGIAEGNNVLCVSADGLEQPFPAYGSPVEAYNAYFSGVGKGGGTLVPPSERLQRDQSLLDHIRGDARKLEGELRGRELEKVQQLQESLFSLEGQLEALYETQAQCEDPQPPPDSVDNANLDPETVAAHGEVLFNTLLCGLTHVAHFSILGREGPHNRYGWLGDTVGHHESHHQGHVDVLAAIDTWMLSQLAALRARLEQVPEGDGTMADHTVIVYINCCGGIHHNGQDTHPVVMLGNAGGQLQTGRYLSYERGEHSLGDVYVSLANLMGLDIDVFGTPEHCKGPLPGLV